MAPLWTPLGPALHEALIDMRYWNTLSCGWLKCTLLVYRWICPGHGYVRINPHPAWV
jgi:hypothetical protein